MAISYRAIFEETRKLKLKIKKEYEEEKDPLNKAQLKQELRDIDKLIQGIKKCWKNRTKEV